jgi:hypothetical protein
MSHQSPYAMHPRPSRAPQHAAAFGGNAVLRGRVQRAMKLIAISCAWITGLAVVIAAVLMVAVATAPIARNSSAAEAQQPPASQAAMAGTASAGRDPAAAGRSPAGQPAGGIAAGRSRAGRGQAGRQVDRSLAHPAQPHDGSTSQPGASAPARILAVYLGLGSANTSQFTIGGTGTWKLGWSYDCAAGTGSPGAFTVSQHGPGSGGGAHVDRRGMAGHGVSWAWHDAGTHYLAIRTQCRWRLTVASRR